MVPRRHQRMLLSILDLDAITVDDIMVPRQEIVGLDLDRSLGREPRGDSRRATHDRLPVYREYIDNIIGVTRVRDLLPELARGELTQALLLERIREPYFVPEGTPLNKQLLNFQQHRRRSAFVVDEYGDVQGLITTQDIVNEIVGELDTDSSAVDLGVTKESDRSYVVDASANVRQLNRVMNWNLPTDGPKTLNGLIVEQLETIPESGTGVTVADYPIEILDASEHGIKRVRVFAPGSRPPPKARRLTRALAVSVSIASASLKPIDAARTSMSERAPRHVRARHERAAEAVLLRLDQPLLAERHGPDLARQPDLAEHDEILRHGTLAQARHDGERDGQVCGRLADAQAADDVREHVARRRTRTPQCRCSTASSRPKPLAVEALRQPPRRLSLRSIDERLHLDEHRPRALARHERHAARRPARHGAPGKSRTDS